MAVIGEVNSSASALNGNLTSDKTAQELSKYEFLKILAEELKNQDPTDPVSNKDFIAQLAQFSSLEQMQNMSEAFSALEGSLESYLEKQVNIDGSLMVMQSAGLIGKSAIAQVDGTNIEGKVESILIKDSVPYAVINATTVPVNSITKISQENEVPGVI